MHQRLNLFDSLSEGRDVEFKSARGGLPASLWETYSAFANTAGGVIYLGIKETDDGLEIQGLDAPDRVLRDFWSAINNRQKVNDNALKIPFERDAEGYRKGETAVHEALQEALVNALIHADHTGQGGIIVDRFPNRFEFSNPGTLLLSLEQLVVGGVSECRNKSLQKMFQMLGAGDKAGSGLDKIRSSWQAQHWQSPSLRETFRPDRVLLSMPLVSMLPAETVDALKADFGQAAIADLIDDEIHTLVTAAAEGRVTNRRLQEMLTRHRVDITQMLGSLVERGVLERHERGRGTYYTIAWRGEGAKACAPDHSPMPTSEALARDVSSVHKDVSSVHKDVSSVHKDVSSVHKEPSTLGSQRAITPPEVLAEQLAEIAEPVHQTQRATPALVEATILALCAVDYLSLQRLGTLLNRNPTRLRTRYIKPLLQTGQLALRYPDKPNHRQQAYRTVEPSDP